MAEVLLTADRTLMSDYHHYEFVGFGTYALQMSFQTALQVALLSTN